LIKLIEVQAIKVNLLKANTDMVVVFQNITTTLVYLYADSWAPGLYSFNKNFTITSETPGSHRNATVLVVAKAFSGILRFEPGIKSLRWSASIKTPGTSAYATFTFAIPAYYHAVLPYYNWTKCYQLPAALQGIHMPTLAWLPGTCNRAIYTLPDCWTTYDLGFDYEWYFVYRYWPTGAPCPEDDCCCTSNFPNGTEWQSCYAPSCQDWNYSYYQNPHYLETCER